MFRILLDPLCSLTVVILEVDCSYQSHYLILRMWLCGLMTHLQLQGQLYLCLLIVHKANLIVMHLKQQVLSMGLFQEFLQLLSLVLGELVEQSLLQWSGLCSYSLQIFLSFSNHLKQFGLIYCFDFFMSLFMLVIGCFPPISFSFLPLS